MSWWYILIKWVYFKERFLFFIWLLVALIISVTLVHLFAHEIISTQLSFMTQLNNHYDDELKISVIGSPINTDKTQFDSKDKFLFFDGWKTNALDKVSLEINCGETVALVGESGSGKSTLGRAIVKLVNIDSGDIVIDSSNINSPNSNDLRNLRSNVQIIFQDPYSSLDPRFSVGRSIAEPIIIQKQCSRSEAKDRVSILLKSVGLTDEMANRYPHEFSGGQRQRVAIARALASEPKFIVADEPTSALDVTIQAQILELLNNLKNERNISLLFITHDLAVVRQISDQVAVMCEGKILEKGPTDSVLGNPQNAYTKSLLDAAPYPDPEKRKNLKRKIDLKSFNTGPLIEIANNHWTAS